jgi:hypothetical protein
MITPLTDLSRYLAGALPFPAGFVPLASETGNHTACVCLTPAGVWARWWAAGTTQQMPPGTQQAVMDVVAEQLGGTSASAAARLDVSPRTFEAWRAGRRPLPIRSAYAISQAIAATTTDQEQSTKPRSPKTSPPPS